MSGGRDFDPERFETLARHVLEQQPWRTADDLAHLMFHLDFSAYRRLGKSLTGASYLRGVHRPEVAEVDRRYYRRLWRSMMPWWARALSWPVVLAVLVGAMRRPRRP